MSKRATFVGTIPALLLALAVTGPAHAATRTCQNELDDVRAQWSKMSPNMTMEKSGNQGVTSAYRQAKTLCAQGKTAEAEVYLNTVRQHLNIPQHPELDDQGMADHGTMQDHK